MTTLFYELKENDNLALVSATGESYTYRELRAIVEEFGSHFTERNLAFCLCENIPGCVASYVACLSSHVVPLLLDRKIDPQLLTELLGTYMPGYVFCPDDMVGKIEGYEAVCRQTGYTMLRRVKMEAIDLCPELGLLLTTSGSTGSPKLVRQSYANIQANAEQIVEYLGIKEGDRPITTLPMNYTYGLSIVNSHLLAGATILMTEASMGMKAFWTFFKEQNATTFGGVPFTYEMLKKLRFFRMDLPSLVYMTQAGGKLSPELHHEYAEWCRERGKDFIVMYGQAEATARMAYLPAEYSLEKYGSMGVPIPGGSFMLKAADGSYIDEPDTVGELIYSGPNVTLGYAVCREDLAKGDERGGILETGDMARRDADGFYYIVGRKKRFLKIFGNRVNLDEIDRLVKTEFEGVDCASTGVDDHMIIYITDMSVADQVRRWIASTTHLSETAFTVRYLEEIPRNESGKVLYKALPTEA